MTMPARDLITATRAGVRGSALNRFGKSAEISSASSKRNGHHDRSTTPPLETLLRARAESPRLTTPVSMPSLRRALVIASAFALALVAFSCVAVVRSPRELVDAATARLHARRGVHLRHLRHLALRRLPRTRRVGRENPARDVRPARRASRRGALRLRAVVGYRCAPTGRARRRSCCRRQVRHGVWRLAADLETLGRIAR